jgi:hypothetical protein
MNSRKHRRGVSPSFVLVFLALVLGGSKASAQKKSAPAAPVKAAAPAKTGAATPKSAAGSKAGSTASHGSTTKGPTTAGPTTKGPTTAGSSTKGPTTGGAHSATAGAGGVKGGSSAHPAAGGAEHRAGGEPNGTKVVHTANGGEIHSRANGTPRDVHANGMNVHHGLDGHRRVEVERADHSRIVAEHGGRGYVQHPYMYHGHEYGRRTYYRGGRAYDHYYGRYYYHGAYMNYYTPGFYYRPAFYGWAYNPWVAPVPYAWGWGGNPWYGYYGYYFTPYPAYASASLWLTDYMISVSLAAAYQNAQEAAAQAAQGGPPPNAAPLTPDVKEMISEEVKRQIALENAESQSAQTATPDPASSSVQRMLTDSVRHVFLVGHELDVVNSAGAECAVSQGDALQLVGPPPPDSPTASLLVLSSKGGIECPKNETVSVQITDLQEMQNHMRETIDAGMGELQTKQGSGNLPTMPIAAKGEPVKASFMTDAPPPDPNVATELSQQYNQGLTAEQQALAGTPQQAGATTSASSAPAPAPAPAPPPAEPTQIALGQSIDDVTAALGTPVRIVDLTTKKIYVYKDLKITFKSGKVSEVQ